MASITQISSATDISGATGTKIKSSTTTSTTTSTATSTATDKAKQLKNQFLGILLTQMQHQNPLDPMDTKEFTGQLTQFSSLEQQIDTNSKLDGLLTSIKQSTLSSAFGYIGQYVDLATDTTAVQNSASNWTYAIPETAKSVNISVTDPSGKVLYSSTMKNPAGGSSIGAGTYKLNLTNSDLARDVENGTVLKMTITATNDANKAITADIHTAVKVESVQSDANGTYLQSGGMLFEIGDVRKIVNAPTTTTTPTTIT